MGAPLKRGCAVRVKGRRGFSAQAKNGVQRTLAFDQPASAGESTTALPLVKSLAYRSWEAASASYKLPMTTHVVTEDTRHHTIG